MKALILAGGGTKLFYMAGWLREVMPCGEFKLIVGCSAGAIAGGVICSAMGDGFSAEQAAELLWSIVQNDVSSPGALFRKRNRLRLTVAAATGRAWPGIYSTAPLRELIQRYVHQPALVKSPIKLIVSIVNQQTDERWMVNPAAMSESVSTLILASAAVPVLLEPVRIRGMLMADGGVKDVAPIGTAIEMGARDITVCLLSNSALPPSEPPAPTLIGQLGWAVRTMEGEILAGDVDEARARSRLAATGAPLHHNDKAALLRISKPSKNLDLGWEFTTKQKLDALDQGRAEGRAFVESQWGKRE